MGELEELSGRIPQVQDLAESLTCHICYELFTGPVLLPCGHSFCSGCVRQNFDFKTNLNQPTVCPNCRAPTDPAHLKASVSLREAVRALKQLSPILKSLVQDAERGAACGNATLVEVPDAEDSTQPEPEAQAHARQQSKAPTAMQTARIRCVDPRAGPAQVVTSGAACLSSPDPIPVHGARSGHMDASVISASVSADEDDEPVSGSRGSGRGTSAAARDQLGGQQQGQERIDLCSSSDDEFQQQGGRQQRQAQGAGAQPATGSGRPLLRSRSRSSSVEVVPASAARGGGQAAQRDEASSEEGDDGGGEDDKDYEPDGERPAKRQRRSSSGRAASGSGAGTGEAGQEAPAAAAAAAGPSRSPRSGLVVPDGYVLCPVCSCTIRAAFCEHHVEACLQKQDRLQQQQQQGRRPGLGMPPAPTQQHRGAGGTQTVQRPAGGTQSAVQPARERSQALSAPRPPSGSGAAAASNRATLSAPARRLGPPVEVPPKLVFTLMKERELKTKLQALGLPTDGKKQDMVDRYTAYRRFIQSKLDEGSTATTGQLRAQFNTQQRQQAAARRAVPRLTEQPGSAAPSSGLPPAPRTHAELIEELKQRAQRNKAAEQQQGAAPMTDRTNRVGAGAHAEVTRVGLPDCSMAMPALQQQQQQQPGPGAGHVADPGSYCLSGGPGVQLQGQGRAAGLPLDLMGRSTTLQSTAPSGVDDASCNGSAQVQSGVQEEVQEEGGEEALQDAWQQWFHHHHHLQGQGQQQQLGLMKPGAGGLGTGVHGEAGMMMGDCMQDDDDYLCE